MKLNEDLFERISQDWADEMKRAEMSVTRHARRDLIGRPVVGDSANGPFSGVVVDAIWSAALGALDITLEGGTRGCVYRGVRRLRYAPYAEQEVLDLSDS